MGCGADCAAAAGAVVGCGADRGAAAGAGVAAAPQPATNKNIASNKTNVRRSGLAAITHLLPALCCLATTIITLPRVPCQ